MENNICINNQRFHIQKICISCQKIQNTVEMSDNQQFRNFTQKQVR